MIFLLKIAKSKGRRPIGKESPVQKKRRMRLFSALNAELRKAGEYGEVRSVVLYNKTTETLSCSGYAIEDKRLFSVLNLNTYITIKRPPCHTLSFPFCKRGYFVRLNRFEPCADNVWVALVGISMGDNETGDILSYPKRPIL